MVNKARTINTGVDEFPRYVIEYLIDNYCEEETLHEDMAKDVRRLNERLMPFPFLSAKEMSLPEASKVRTLPYFVV